MLHKLASYELFTNNYCSSEYNILNISSNSNNYFCTDEILMRKEHRQSI